MYPLRPFCLGDHFSLDFDHFAPQKTHFACVFDQKAPLSDENRLRGG